jgi:HJR/Mrr/RecB family endonuclease
VLVSNEEQTPATGQTTTRLDDWLMQLIAPLPLAAIVALAIAVYALWGIALPMLPNAGTSWLLSFNTEGAIFAGAIILARAFPVIEARLRRHRLELTTDLRQLSAREFEQLVGEMFRQEGWDVTETGRHGEADGGIDLRLTKGSEQRLVQCKRWTSYSVGVDEVRQLGGILLAEGLPGAAGVIVTTAEFTKAAAHAAQQLGLEIVDGEALVRTMV